MSTACQYCVCLCFCEPRMPKCCLHAVCLHIYRWCVRSLQSVICMSVICTSFLCRVSAVCFRTPLVRPSRLRRLSCVCRLYVAHASCICRKNVVCACMSCIASVVRARVVRLSCACISVICLACVCYLSGVCEQTHLCPRSMRTAMTAVRLTVSLGTHATPGEQ